MKPNRNENTITTIDLLKFDLHNVENQHIVEWMPEPISAVVAVFRPDPVPGCPLIGDTHQYVMDEAVTTPVEATECVEYRFVDWTCDNGYSTSEHVITLSNVYDDVICYAHYELSTREVLFIVDPADVGKGYLSGDVDQTVVYNGTCTPVTAHENPGHSFRYWTLDGEIYSYSRVIAPDHITTDRTYVAHFTDYYYYY